MRIRRSLFGRRPHRSQARGWIARIERLESRLVMDGAILSEFVASNGNGLTDLDGDHPDWVELYNPTASPVDLAGWSLTDDAANLNKWRFPTITLNPSGFLVVFASNKNRAIAGAELHTNFKLSAAGGYLALVKPDGTVVDDFGVTYPSQTTDISMGLIFDATPLIRHGDRAEYQVPTSGALESAWHLPSYTPDAGWLSGRTGLGYGVLKPGFNVDYYKANVAVTSLASAFDVITNPALQTLKIPTSASTINYLGNGGGANFASDQPFPTQAIGQDLDDFVIDAKGVLTIPSAGEWSFGVNSDDGFLVTLERNGTQLSFAFDSLRAPGDTIQVLNVPEAGSWNVRLVFFEHGGGASVEFFAAVGNRPTFDGGAFRLLGSPGGLAVGSVLSEQRGDEFLLARFVADDLNTLEDGAVVSSWTDRDPDANGAIRALGSGSPMLRKGTLNGRSTIQFNVFDGPENLRIASANNPLVGALDFTAAVVFRTTTPGYGQAGTWYENAGLLDADVFGATDDWGLAFNAPGQVAAGIGNPELSVYSTTKGLNDGNAHLAVITHTSGVLRVYVDGRLESERADTNSAPRTLGDLVIGSLQSNLNFFVGEIAEVRLYGEDLTPSEIRRLAEELDATYGLSGVELATVTTDLRDEMQGLNATLYVRIPFNSPDPSTFEALSLRMQYDDGFVAYLNGVEVARANAPASPGFNSQANAARASSPTAVETFGLTAFLGLLQPGENLLAIRGLNAGASDDDFLILPELTGLKLHQDEVRYFATPTPGSANANPYLGVVSPVVASVKRGFFSAPFELSLTSPTVGAQIRYTIDGSDPSPTNGLIFNAPITISATTTLRANAFVDDYLVPSPIVQSYLFLDDVIRQSPEGLPPEGWPYSWGSNAVDYGMDPDIVDSAEYGGETLKNALRAIPSLSITTGLDNLFDSATGIYANAYQQGNDWEREAAVELLNPDGSAGFGINAGLRIRGGYSRSTDNPKHSFRLFFRGEYGASSLEFPLFGAEGVDSFTKMDLRTAQNYSWSFGGDPSNNFIAEVFSRDTSRALDQPYTRSRFYHLYLNGQYWGLYQTEERPDANFGASYLGGNKDDYDVIKVETGPYITQATDGNLDAWYRLYQASTDSKAPLADDANYFKLQGKNANGSENLTNEVLLDVDNLIDYMVVILYSGNFDSPISAFLGNNAPNNFFAIRDRTGRQGFQYIQRDAEHSLKSVQENRNGPFPAGENFVHFNPQYLHQQLMANANYRQAFGDTVQREFFGSGALTVSASLARFRSRATEIDQAIIAESARWGDSRSQFPLTRENWLSAVSYVTDYYIPNRQAVFLDQLRAVGLLPVIDAPRFQVNGVNSQGGDIESTDLIRFTASAGVVYYTKDGWDPRTLSGGIARGALLFMPGSSPSITLSASALITARAYNSGTWSAVVSAQFTNNIPASANNLAITEIHYNPVAPNLATGELNVDKDEFEFIELKNTGDTEISLAGVKFTVGIGFDFTSAGITRLAPGAYLVVVKNLAAFQSRYGTSRPVAGSYGSAFGGLNSLSNGGERILLVAANGATIADFTYDDIAPWPVEPDGLGSSLILVDTAVAGNQPDNWRASPLAGGSPGAVNNLAPTISAITNRTIDEDTTSPAIPFTLGDPESPIGSLIVLVSSSNLALLPLDRLTTSGTGSSRTIVAVPAPNAHGSTTIRVTVTDPFGASTVASFVLTVNSVNDAPIAVEDFYETLEGVALTIPAIDGVSKNDVDPDSPSLTPSLVKGPTYGQLALQSNGAFVYKPDANYHGTDRFTYRSYDGVLASDIVNVTLTITSVATPPVLPVLNAVTVDEGTGLAFRVAATDGDLPDDTLTYSLVGTVPQGATIDSRTGAFFWTPTEAQGPGSYRISIGVTDSTSKFATSSFTVTVNEVNNAPVVALIADATIPEGGRFTATATATDSDQPGHAIRYRLEPGSPLGASVDSISGAIAWSPSGTQGLGRYLIIVSAYDANVPSLFTSWTTSVNVVNVPPSVDLGGPITIEEGDSIAVSGLISDTSTGAFLASVDYGDGSGTQSLLLAFDGSFVLNHLYAVSGSYIVTVRASDSRKAQGTATLQVSVASTPLVTLTPGSVKTITGQRAATAINLRFSGDVDATSVVNLANYRLVSAGKDRKLGTRDDKAVALATASYAAVSRTVTLTSRKKLPKGKLKLFVNSGGLRDLRGRAADGDRDGKVGGDFAANLTRTSLTLAAVPRPSRFSTLQFPRS